MLSQFQQAIINGNLAEVIQLVANGIEINPITEHPPLCLASDKGHIAIVAFLLENGAQVDWDGESNIPVRPLEWAIRRNHLEIVRRLLDAGAKVDAEDFMGESPLISAISFGCTEIVKLLLERGAKVDQIHINNDTPLHWACSHQAGNVNMVKDLIEYGADFNRSNSYGQTPLMLAIYKNDLLSVNWLMTYILLKNPEEAKPEEVKENRDLSIYWDDKLKKIDYLREKEILGVESRLKEFLHKVIHKKDTLHSMSLLKFMDTPHREAQRNLLEEIDKNKAIFSRS